MKFTVVFNAHESINLSYGLVFIPCPCWVRSGEEAPFINLNPESPHYKLGSVGRLLNQEKYIQQGYLGQPKQAIIIVHKTGHGTFFDLETLEADLLNEGFETQIVFFTRSATPNQ